MNEVRRQQGPDAAADEPLTRPEPIESAGSEATQPTEEEKRTETENWIRDQLAGKAAVTERSGAASGGEAEATATADDAATASEVEVEVEDTVPVTDSSGDPATEGTGASATEVDGTEAADAAEAGSEDTGSEADGGAADGGDDAEEPKIEALPAYRRFDVTGSDPVALAEAADAARTAIENGECVVLPTDTVYGIGADAFEPDAVQRLQDTKDRGRDKPPPVLIGEPALIRALSEDVPELAVNLTEKHWPGALTVIVKARDSLRVDLGETNGTIGLRVPDYELTRDLLRQTGPMAVSSANLSGRPSALTCDEAIEYFGNKVSVYLDGGPVQKTEGASSSIVDFSQNDQGELLRLGALSLEVLRETCPDLVDLTAPDGTVDEVANDPDSGGDEASAEGETEAAAAGGAVPADGTVAGDETDDVPETSEDVERLIEDQAATDAEASDPAVDDSKGLEPEGFDLKGPEPEGFELKDPEPKAAEPTEPEPKDSQPKDSETKDPEPEGPAPVDPNRQT